MAPRIALHAGKSLCRELNRPVVHEQSRINQDMWRVGENFAPPAVRIERAVDKTVTETGGDFRLVVADGAQVIAGDVKTLPVELAHPSFDRNFPVGMAVEKAADDADTDHFAGCRGRGQRWRRKTPRDHPADDVTVDLLQRAVI